MTKIVETCKQDTFPLIILDGSPVLPFVTKLFSVTGKSQISALEIAFEQHPRLVVLSSNESDGLSVATLVQLEFVIDENSKAYHFECRGVQRVRIINKQTNKNHLVCTTEKIETDFNGKSKEYLEYAKAQLIDFCKKVARKYNVLEENQLEQINKDKSLEEYLHCVIDLLEESKIYAVLEIDNIFERIKKFRELIEFEINRDKVNNFIDFKVRSKLTMQQRRYFLKEQLKIIRDELEVVDVFDHSEDDDYKSYKNRALKAKLPQTVAKKVFKEIEKLQKVQPMSSEYTNLTFYLDTILDLPWNTFSEPEKSLQKVQRALEKKHFGLSKVKQRILEMFAIEKRTGDFSSSPILCLVGPPGVGKTSLAESIAAATGRSYIRIALGGVRDEAAIRGFRRTYIGSLPGRIAQGIAKAGTMNPLILLDEVDKIASDFRGDPASALLEVLDPEQNKHFTDHYLEVELDLSKSLFLCTSNSFNIPAALMDRMEIIQLPSYTELEKIQIARKHLVKKYLTQNGVLSKEVRFNHSAILEIIQNHTSEAGVRELGRNIDKIIRKVVFQQLSQQSDTTTATTAVINNKNIKSYLGDPIVRAEYSKKLRAGQVIGLAWTQNGGQLLRIEVAAIPGKGNIICTGSLGGIMKESMRTALSVVKYYSKKWHIARKSLDCLDYHIHLPEGAIPKDGPSAGIGICLALVSELTEIAIKSSIAMTGEISLKGQVLPIGGLKEKLLAAKRHNIERVLIPKPNWNNLTEIDSDILENIEIIPVSHIDEVIAITLQK